MTMAELRKILSELMALPAETEWVEFKEAKNNFHFDDLGKYFSALSNEANLKRQDYGWLVLGVTDRPPRKVVGTRYRSNRPALDKLKKEIADHTTNRLTFEEIHEVNHPDGRVLMFQVPSALKGMPTPWKGHFYGREGESLDALSLNEIEQIRGQAIREDWSARICERATIRDLDPDAIGVARKQYKEKNPRQVEEVDKWDDQTFLNKARVCINSEITNTAIALLGKDESEHFISPAIARISWVLQDSKGIGESYEHFGPPFLLAVNRVFSKIRNLTYRYLPDSTLFPIEIKQYDPWVIRETLHNCIAHQDYTKQGRINVVEEAESLLFTNAGYFIPGSVEEVIRRDAPPEQYRNPFLAQAMVNLNMIDTIGSGIKRMFLKQRQRFFPMPDYDLGELDRVKVRLFGKILDQNYTRILVENTGINLIDVIALDKVQKKRGLTEEEFRRLKRKQLVEGRRPNLYVSAKIAAVTGDKSTYIRHLPFDKAHYKKMIVSYLRKFGGAKRKDIDALLIDKISDALSDQQKKQFVTNLLQEMRREGVINSEGVTRWAKWFISKTAEKK